MPGSPTISTRPIGPTSPMRSDGLPRLRLAGGQVGEVGPVAFHRVDHRQAGGAKPLDQPLHRRHDRRDPADVVAEARAEAARLGEVALHVDDDQRHGLRLEGEGKRLRIDLSHQ